MWRILKKDSEEDREAWAEEFARVGRYWAAHRPRRADGTPLAWRYSELGDGGEINWLDRVTGLIRSSTVGGKSPLPFTRSHSPNLTSRLASGTYKRRQSEEERASWHQMAKHEELDRELAAAGERAAEFTPLIEKLEADELQDLIRWAVEQRPTHDSVIYAMRQLRPRDEWEDLENYDPTTGTLIE